LPELFHHRWAVPTLALLGTEGGGAKFVTLQRRLGVARDSLKRTLAALIAMRLVARNPGYGHPMRPEYVLTAAGQRLAPPCGHLVDRMERLGVTEIALNKWSLPLVHVLSVSEGRFNVILEMLETITPRALARALSDLQKAGLVERRVVDGHPPRTDYALSKRGRELATAVKALRPPREQ